MVLLEKIEDPQIYKYFIKPDKNDFAFSFYKKAQESFWVEEEIDSELKKDLVHWNTLDSKIKHLIIHQIAFFLIGDGIVNKTISENIDCRIQDRQIQLWYNFQKMMEDIHNIVYFKLCDTYITDPDEKNKILSAVENYPILEKKINWLNKWLAYNEFHQLSENTLNLLRNSVPKDSELWLKMSLEKPSLAHQILINLIMEGLFFQGSFCIIFWINHQYGKLPGLTKANEWISRDEGLHTKFGITLYNTKINHRLTQDQVHQIMDEAVNIEIEFMSEALPESLLNMNINLMSEYIKFIADKILLDLKYEKKYFVNNPFKFMEKQSISVRMSDFFIDQNVSDYGHHSAGLDVEDFALDLSDDF